jgi:hypothetical protein
MYMTIKNKKKHFSYFSDKFIFFVEQTLITARPSMRGITCPQPLFITAASLTE